MLINQILLHVKRDDVEPSKGSVIITHGIAEHSGRYDEITKILNEASFSVVRYDLRGHGQSQGKRGALKSFHQFIDDLHMLVIEEKKRNPQKVFLLGHSMGGTIVDMYGMKYHDVDGIISSAGLTSFLKDVLPFRFIGYRWLGWMTKKTNFADDQLSRIKEVEQAYIDDPLVLKKFYFSLAGTMFVSGVRYMNKNIQAFETPILLIHGESDKITPVEFSKRFFDNLPIEDKTLITYPNAYHEVFNDLGKEKAFQDVVDWLNAHV